MSRIVLPLLSQDYHPLASPHSSRVGVSTGIAWEPRAAARYEDSALPVLGARWPGDRAGVPPLGGPPPPKGGSPAAVLRRSHLKPEEPKILYRPGLEAARCDCYGRRYRERSFAFHFPAVHLASSGRAACGAREGAGFLRFPGPRSAPFPFAQVVSCNQLATRSCALRRVRLPRLACSHVYICRDTVFYG